MSRASGLPEVALPAGTCVIADLHLDPRRSETWADFQAWLRRSTRRSWSCSEICS
ncbi:MAG: hypothetical protein HOP15_12230, partial [Planctomycetes bacterium]|nr:hypothetical protein [Planctomycetota bacterium]